MIKSSSAIPINLIPENDVIRLKHLRSYQLLDSAPEEAFDKVARLAALIFNASGAFITLVDEERVFFKSNVSALQGNQVPREQSLCSIAIHYDDVTVFNDTHDFPQLLANPFCNGAGGIRFYAGAPLLTPEGTRLGTVCVTDAEPMLVTERQLNMLSLLASVIMDELALRLEIANLKEIL